MIEEIRPELFQIQVPLPNSPLKYLNSYVVRSPERSLVIDTGLNSRVCLEALQGGLDKLGLDPGRTDFFITHLHADHFGLVPRLVTPTSRVYVNQPEAELIEAEGWWEPMLASARRHGFPESELQKAWKDHPGYKYGADWAPARRLLQDGDLIEAGDYSFNCILTPGHSVGHTCLYDVARKLLVAGDHILIDITPNIQSWSDSRNPLGDYLRSLDRVHGLEIGLALPGHRRLIEDARSRITELKSHHEARCDEVLNILDGAELSGYLVASRMHWDIKSDSWDGFPSAQKWFATGEALAHLRYLEELGKIQRRTGETGVVFCLG